MNCHWPAERWDAFRRETKQIAAKPPPIPLRDSRISLPVVHLKSASNLKKIKGSILNNPIQKATSSNWPGASTNDPIINHGILANSNLPLNVTL